MGADGSRRMVEPMSHPRTPDRTRRWVPWVGQATTADKLLMGAILAVIALGVALQPAKPFLIASHPVLLEFLTGDLVVIGAAAAFARVGEEPLWLVVLAGAVGMVKFDVLTWWAGRRWGEGMIRVLSNSRQAQRWTRRLDRTRPWILRAAVVLAMAPGVPTAIVFAAAGWARMRLTTVSLALIGLALAMPALKRLLDQVRR